MVTTLVGTPIRRDDAAEQLKRSKKGLTNMGGWKVRAELPKIHKISEWHAS